MPNALTPSPEPKSRLEKFKSAVKDWRLLTGLGFWGVNFFKQPLRSWLYELIDFIGNAQMVSENFTKVIDFFLVSKWGNLVFILSGLGLIFSYAYSKRGSDGQATPDPVLTHPQSLVQENQAPLKITTTLLQEMEKYLEIKKLEPNLQTKGAVTVDVHQDEEGAIVFGNSASNKTFSALVVKYHNNDQVRSKSVPSRKVGGIEEVSAEITFSRLDKYSTLKIQRGAWLSEKDSRVSFRVNDTYNLIIATIEEDEPHEPTVSAIRRDYDTPYKGNIPTREELHGDLISVTVRLIAEAESKTVAIFKYILEISREPEIKLELQDAKYWVWLRLQKFTVEGLGFSDRLTEGENEEKLAEEVHAWETEAADFIGKHIGGSQKTSFLDARPTIEQALRQEPQLSRTMLPRPHNPFALSNARLQDSLKARTDYLRQLENNLH